QPRTRKTTRRPAFLGAWGRGPEWAVRRLRCRLASTWRQSMIDLTPEQRQAVAKGEPVRILDEASQDTYVLVRAEVFERMAGGLSPRAEDRAAPDLPAPLPPGEQPARVRLRDLPAPPEVVAEAERWRKTYGGRAQDVDDRVKLQYYYGGQTVYGVRTLEGLVVVPIPDRYKGAPDLRY